MFTITHALQQVKEELAGLLNPSVIMQTCAESRQRGGQREGCGFPVAHLLTVFDAASNLLQQVVLSPLRTHDMAHIQKVYPALREEDVVVADRGFCSFVHVVLLLRQMCHVVFRVHQRQIDTNLYHL